MFRLFSSTCALSWETPLDAFTLKECEALKQIRLERDCCVSWAHEVLAQHRLTFAGFTPEQMLGQDQLIIGAVAMFHRKWGVLWPLHARVFQSPVPTSISFNPPRDLIDLFKMPYPEIGVSFLHTALHYMMSLQTPEVLLALDGYANPHPQCEALTKVARKEFIQMGFPFVRVDLW